MSKKQFQDRYLVSLDKTEKGETIRKILLSTNELSKEIIKILFENNFNETKEKLDSIKKFVAGISRAESFSSSYKLADYYSYLFSFHQYFHSSYRARQGKTLEALLNEILIECGPNFKVADKTKEKGELAKEIFPDIKGQLDMDAVCRKNKDSYLMIQLRSRDDTGGTTAKASLVDFLKKSFDWGKNPRKKLLYIVTIWDEIKSNQKKMTKVKIYDSLKHLLPPSISEEVFINKIEKGVVVKKDITLKMVYGTKELAETLGEWAKPEAIIGPKTIGQMIERVENWDDLWLSYAIVSLELENQRIRGFSNVEILNKYLSIEDIRNILESSNIVKAVNKIALDISPQWKEDSIPLNSLSEKIHYIRDLILLRCIYEIS